MKIIRNATKDDFAKYTFNTKGSKHIIDGEREKGYITFYPEYAKYENSSYMVVKNIEDTLVTGHHCYSISSKLEALIYFIKYLIKL